MMKSWLVSLHILSLVMVLTLLTGCWSRYPFHYSAEPIEAWVVDEETEEPLEGVVVVAQWELYAGMQPHVVEQLMVMETVTDKNGRFYFPAWGPKVTLKGYLRNAPRIIFFKSGYEWGGVSNFVNQESLYGTGGPIRHSEWNGKRIKLKKFQGSLEEYAEDLSNITITLGFALQHSTAKCEWKMIPRMVVALHKQKVIFDKYNVYNRLYSIEDLARMSPKSCGSSQSFFRSYL